MNFRRENYFLGLSLFEVISPPKDDFIDSIYKIILMIDDKYCDFSLVKRELLNLKNFDIDYGLEVEYLVSLPFPENVKNVIELYNELNE